MDKKNRIKQKKIYFLTEDWRELKKEIKKVPLHTIPNVFTNSKTLVNKDKIKTISEKELSEKEDLNEIWTYYYDDKDRIIKIEISGEEYNEISGLYGSHYSVEQIELLYKSKPAYEFQYDDQDRVIEFKVTTSKGEEGKKTHATHLYTYHPKKGYLQTKEVILSKEVVEFSMFHSCGHFKFSYNKFGDIAEKQFLCREYGDYMTGLRVPIEGEYDQYCTRYYEYEYDKYNNWVKCYMYLRGDKTLEPTIIGTRIIEYYED